MAGTFPTSPKPKEIALIHDQPIFSDIAQSGKSQRRISAGHLWKMKLPFPPMERDNFSTIYAFIIKQRGESFTITLPNLNTPSGVGTGTPLTAAIQSAGDTVIATDGWTASQTGIMKAGDVLKFSSHAKVYMMVENADSDVGGLSTLTIDPPIVSDLASNEAITVLNVPFTVAVDVDGVNEYKTTAPAISSFSIDLIEAL